MFTVALQRGKISRIKCNDSKCQISVRVPAAAAGGRRASPCHCTDDDDDDEEQQSRVLQMITVPIVHSFRVFKLL